MHASPWHLSHGNLWLEHRLALSQTMQSVAQYVQQVVEHPLSVHIFGDTDRRSQSLHLFMA